MTGAISLTADADIIFRWKRLPGTTNHGEYGKYVIRASHGGLWFWGQERLFAPKEGYEDGMIYYYEPRSLATYMKKRRCEFFATSRDGQVYARVFAQLDTGKATLSLRGRANSSTNRFVDAKGEPYAIGVYGSLSPDYLNPGVPWWCNLGSWRQAQAQVILSEKHAKEIFSGDINKLRCPEYFAAHYQTPAAVLAAMAGGPLMENYYVPQHLAQNCGAPPSFLRELKAKVPGWKLRDIDRTLSTPDDLRLFLTTPE